MLTPANVFRVAILVLAFPIAGLSQTPFLQGAPRGSRTLDSVLPNEAIDPLSGSLTLVANDLVPPGNAGDLRVQRVYSSSIYPDYEDNSTALEVDSWAGIGWRSHSGRVLNPDPSGAAL